MTLTLLSISGDIERFVSEELYPLRVPITVLLVVALVGGLYLAYRAELHLLLWRHRLASTLVGVPVLVVAVIAGNYFLSPLWERSYANEAPPVVAATGEAPTPSTVGSGADEGAPAPEPTPEVEVAATEGIVLAGEIAGADDFHFGEGRALVIETAPGSYVLRFEEFSVRNGPDLFVYVSPDPDGYTDAAINLGELKATDGAFNYDIPAGTTLEQLKSAIVWCKQFSVLFASAPLTPPQ